MNYLKRYDIDNKTNFVLTPSNYLQIKDIIKKSNGMDLTVYGTSRALSNLIQSIFNTQGILFKPRDDPDEEIVKENKLINGCKVFHTETTFIYDPDVPPFCIYNDSFKESIIIFKRISNRYYIDKETKEKVSLPIYTESL